MLNGLSTDIHDQWGKWMILHGRLEVVGVQPISHACEAFSNTECAYHISFQICSPKFSTTRLRRVLYMKPYCIENNTLHTLQLHITPSITIVCHQFASSQLRHRVYLVRVAWLQPQPVKKNQYFNI